MIACQVRNGCCPEDIKSESYFIEVKRNKKRKIFRNGVTGSAYNSSFEAHMAVHGGKSAPLRRPHLESEISEM